MGSPTSPLEMPPGTVPFSGMDQLPSFLAQLLQMRQQQGQQGQASGASDAPGGTPAKTPGQIQAPNPPFAGGGLMQGNVRLPGQLSPESQASARPKVPGPISFGSDPNSKGAQRVAVVATAINAFGQVAGQIKQHKFDKESAKAEQLWGSYMALTQAANDATDPQQKQQIQKQLQTLLSDEKNHKIIEKGMDDPQSPYGVGLQRAMTQSKAEAEQKQKLDTMRAQMQAEQQRGQQEAATAQLRRTQAEQEGQVTPRVAAEIQGRIDVAKASAQATADREGPKLTVRGLQPAVTFRGQTYDLNDLKNDPGNVPPNVAKTLGAEYQTSRQNIETQFRKQAQTFAQQMKMYNNRLDETQKKDMARIYGPAISADILAGTADKNAQLAPTDANAARALLDAYLGTKASAFSKTQFQGLAKQQSILGKLQIMWGGPNGETMQSVTIPQDVAQGMATTLRQKASDARKTSDDMANVLGLQPPPSFNPDEPPSEPQNAPPAGAVIHDFTK